MSLPQDQFPIQTMQPPQAPTSRDELAKATYASLLDRPSSALAVSLCSTLLDDLLLHRQNPKPRAKQREAFGALIANLLHRDPSDHGGWCYRSKRPDSFNGEAVGYKVFRPIFEAMDAEDLIETQLGQQFWTNTELTGGRWQVVNQQSTRFRATPQLREVFESHGITHTNWSDHFQRDADATRKAQRKPKPSLMLRGDKPPRSTGISKRPSLPIDRKDPAVAAMEARMVGLNGFLAGVNVQPYGPTVHLQRILSEGHLPDHQWRQGGRLYAIGGKGNYQNAKKDERKAITIDGKPTVELDVQASHLTILVGLGHLPLECLKGDPYAIEGIPRGVVKQWATMTLSHGKRHRAWPKAVASEFREKHGINLGEDFPIRRTGDAILKKLPLIQNDGQSVPVGWGELQFRESEVILATMEALAFNHGTPSLPVHDSLIVPVDAKGLAMSALREAFRSSLGVVPEIDEGHQGKTERDNLNVLSPS